jgi:DNA-3-methyladenine glycosylase
MVDVRNPPSTIRYPPSESPMPSAKKLARSFYSRSTLQVAQDIHGRVHLGDFDGRRLSGRIVETEAYVGPHDLACHASKGHTPRTSIMFGPAGYAYVYMIYGFYFCLNVVTERKGYPAAVLIRGVEPLENLDFMRQLRNNPERDTNIASGPGKLCKAMSIDKRLNGEDLLGQTLWIEDRKLDSGTILTSPRVGVDYAGEYKDKPWRFYLANNPHVSKVRFK